MTDENKARHLLAFWIRQNGGQPLPAQVPTSPALLALTDAATAQKLWTELLAECQARAK